MRYRDLFQIDNGIFTKVFSEYFPDAYNTIFSDLSCEHADIFTYLNYGDKKLSIKINNDNYIDVIKSVISMNVLTWLKTIEVFNTEYDALEPLIYRETFQGNKQLEESDNKEVLQAEKTFNDNTFNDDRQEKNNSTRERQEGNDYESSRIGLNNFLHPTDAIQKEIKLKSENLKKSIIFEFINQITIKIY